jgi:hypothetical protein
MVTFALDLLRALEGNGAVGSYDRTSTNRLLCAMAVASDDVALLVHRLIDPPGGDALAPNRALIKGSHQLISLGLGTCFTSWALVEQANDAVDGVGGAATAARAALAMARADKTTTVVVFLDPEHDDDRGGNDHAFELVYGAPGQPQRKYQLRHGTVLVSRSARPWTVVPRAVGASGSGGGANKKRLHELHFFVSRRVVELCTNGAFGAAGPSSSPSSPPCYSARELIDHMVTGDGDGGAARASMTRAEAVAMFAQRSA